MFNLFTKQQDIRVDSEITKENQALRQRIDALSEVNDAMAGVLDTQSVLDLITQKLVSVLGVSFADVFIWDNATESIHLKSITIPKYVKTIIEKAIAKPIETVVFSARNPSDLNNHYIKSLIEGKTLKTKSLYDLSNPMVNERTSQILQRLVGMKSAITIPLIIKGEKLGVLGLIWKEEQISKEDEISVATFANQISTVIYNSKLFEQTKAQVTQLEQQNKDMGSLYNLTASITQSLDSKKVAQDAVDSLPRNTNMIGVIISLLNKEKTILTPYAVSQNKVTDAVKKIIGDFSKYAAVVKGNPAPSTRAILEGIPIFSNDIAGYLGPPIPPGFANTIQSISKLKSMVSYPLFFRSGVAGVVVYAMGDVTAEQITPNQKNLLQTYTSQIAIALENAQLFEQSQEIQRNLEKALADLQEARRRERDMIDIMGHELRTPISIVRNSLSMMDIQLQKDGAISVEKQHKYVSIALESARRESKLIETLLSATKADSKGFQLTFEKVDLVDVVEDSIEGYKTEALKKGLQLIFEHKKDEDRFIYCDRTRIQEVVDNLISNSVKYTLKGYVKVSIVPKDAYYWVIIEDTGMGIAKEDLQNLGKKFFRAKQYIDDKPGVDVIRPGGTGLGLYVSFSLIRLMDGDYRVYSEVGKGSRFMFAMPMFNGQKTKQEERVSNLGGVA